MDRVVLNVGGCLFQTTYTTLKKYPDTRLGQLSKDSEHFSLDKNEFFFDRNPDFFNSLLDFYRNNELHLPNTYCGASLRQELKFWNIPIESISECCLEVYFKYENDKEMLDTLKSSFEGEDMDYNIEDVRSSKFVWLVRTIWLFLDKPKSSFPAKVFSYFYFFVVVLSILMFILGSHPAFRYDIDLSYFDNETIWAMMEGVNQNNPKDVMMTFTLVYPELIIIEWICLFFFTLEFILHFLSCPYKNKFFRSCINVLDAVVVVTMLSVFFMEMNIEIVFSTEAGVWSYLVLKALVICRLFRLFRLVKQCNAMKILHITIKSSWKELLLLLLSFLMAVTFFAAFVYYAEFVEPTTFQDILIAIWWAIVTMTTVGYGDEVPKTFVGRVIGAVCAMCGLLILAMPVAIVASNFSYFHSRYKERKLFLRLKSKPSFSAKEDKKPHFPKSLKNTVSVISAEDQEKNTDPSSYP